MAVGKPRRHRRAEGLGKGRSEPLFPRPRPAPARVGYTGCVDDLLTEGTAMAKAAAAAPAEKVALYEKLVATNPKVERKGATMPYTSLNGHMFSYLSKEGKMALRLADADREAFLQKYKT